MSRQGTKKIAKKVERPGLSTEEVDEIKPSTYLILMELERLIARNSKQQCNHLDSIQKIQQSFNSLQILILLKQPKMEE